MQTPSLWEIIFKLSYFEITIDQTDYQIKELQRKVL